MGQEQTLTIIPYVIRLQLKNEKFTLAPCGININEMDLRGMIFNPTYFTSHDKIMFVKKKPIRRPVRAITKYLSTKGKSHKEQSPVL